MSKYRVPLIFFISGVVLLIFFLFFRYRNIFDNKVDFTSKLSDTNKTLLSPQISGWAAWWEEPKAYELAAKYPNKFLTLSPVWFMVDENLELKEVGIKEKKEVVLKLHNLGIKVLPSLGSELTGGEMSPLFSDQDKKETLIKKLTDYIINLGADGLDVDLESIKESDKDSFTNFLREIADNVHDNKLTISVTVHAQTSKLEWEGVLGQDLEEIGKLADEVRIMVYDKHSASTQSGPIAPISWIKDVVKYNAKLIDNEKIVIGIPSYGYIWTESYSKGLQYDEFQNYIKNTEYTKHIDTDSGELVFTTDDYEGWLSDSNAMKNKIDEVRSLGFNRFIIWHLGGMDEKFFEQIWPD